MEFFINVSTPEAGQPSAQQIIAGKLEMSMNHCGPCRKFAALSVATIITENVFSCQLGSGFLATFAFGQSRFSTLLRTQTRIDAGLLFNNNVVQLGRSKSIRSSGEREEIERDKVEAEKARRRTRRKFHKKGRMLQ
jgi:hypothetical protein